MQKTFMAVTLGILLGVGILVGNYVLTSQPVTEDAKPLSDTEAYIKKLEDSVAANPDAIDGYISLAQAYLELVRVTGDTQLYAKTTVLLDQAAALQSDSVDIPALRALVSAGQHHFTQAEVLIDEAIAREPNRARFYGIKGDVALQRGKYEAAVVAYQTMVDLRPDFNSLTRIAHLRLLYGDHEGALAAYQRAIEAGASYSENLAWAYVQMGDIYLRTDTGQASEHYNTALKLVPNYAPALSGLARAAFFAGDTSRATDYATQAFDAFSTAEYATLVGDVYQYTGDTTERDAYYTLAEVAIESSEQSGIDVDAGYALFLSERGRDPEEAFARAKRGFETQQTLATYDTYALALYQQGHFAYAHELLAQAAQLPIAPFDTRFLLHRAQVATKLGNTDTAREYLDRALQQNSKISLIDYRNLMALKASLGL